MRFVFTENEARAIDVITEFLLACRRGNSPYVGQSVEVLGTLVRAHKINLAISLSVLLDTLRGLAVLYSYRADGKCLYRLCDRVTPDMLQRWRDSRWSLRTGSHTRDAS